jgi:hypothetical protein
MELKTKGTAINVTSPIVGRVTTNPYCTDQESILVSDEVCLNHQRFNCIITTNTISNIIIEGIYVERVSFIHHLIDGDIVVVNTDGIVNTLYRVKSFQNAILVTERCNSNCLMCSQPPKDRQDIPYLHNIHRRLLPLIPKAWNYRR